VRAAADHEWARVVLASKVSPTSARVVFLAWACSVVGRRIEGFPVS